MPPFDPGDLSTISLRQQSSAVTDDAVDKTLERLRERAAKYETVEGRPVADGDTVVARTRSAPIRDGKVDHHESVIVELGAPGNPPGFDAESDRAQRRATRRPSSSTSPRTTRSKELANTDVTYHVTVKEIRRKVLPELDDEFAKDVGEFESLAALRDRVRADMQADAENRCEAARAERPAEAARPADHASSCPLRSSSARSIAGSRSSRGS